MAPRSWAAHFGRDKPKPESAPAPPPPGALAGLVDFLRQWQIGVAVIAGSVGVLFSVADFQQKKLEINQKALEFVRAEAQVKRFWADPQNMINEIEASFPRHAFCSTLGFYLAESARADLKLTRGESGAVDGPTVDSVNRAREALDEEVSRIGDDAGADPAALRAQAEEAARNDRSCAKMRAGTGWLGRAWVERECRLVLDAYGENLCLTKREPLRIARTAATAQAPIATAPTTTLPERACAGDGPLLVFVQFTDAADRDRAVAAMTALQNPAWSLVGPDLVASTRDQGGVRYYFDAQKPCAESLARAAARVLARDTLPIQSLQGRYSNLRQDRMELWLPDFN